MSQASFSDALALHALREANIADRLPVGYQYERSFAILDHLDLVEYDQHGAWVPWSVLCRGCHGKGTNVGRGPEPVVWYPCERCGGTGVPQ